MFQSYPLADKSSVNLRGDYHVNNVTIYDRTSPKPATNSRHMDVNVKETKTANGMTHNHNISTSAKSNQSIVSDPALNDATADKIKTSNGEPISSALDIDTLYPMFWSLQEYFSVPTKLFDASNLKTFKNGLQAALTKFEEVERDFETSGSGRTPEESKRGIKRKRGSASAGAASSFNPKYLTSRDLFELEVNLYCILTATRVC